MIQLLRVLNVFHQHSKFGKLNEDTVYMSSSLNTVYVDPGFYVEDDLEISDYLNPPENQQSNIKNEKTDIYCAGFILIKFLTQSSSNEMQEIFNLKLTPKTSPTVSLLIPRKFSSTQKFPYFQNFQKELGKYKVNFQTAVLTFFLGFL